MKLLTAAVDPDPVGFSDAVPGELVYLGPVCGIDEADEFGDGGCGCGRSFAGLASDRGTTLAVVADVDLTAAQLEVLVADSLRRAGWDVAEDLAHEVAADMVDAAAPFPVGTRVRRTLDRIEAQP